MGIRCDTIAATISMTLNVSRTLTNGTPSHMSNSTPQSSQPEPLVFRRAKRHDVPTMVRMLASDTLGAKREAYADPLPESYYRAFDAIDCDPNNELVVVQIDGRVVGMLQMTFIPYLTYKGRWRALIEGVRIESDLRSRGMGRELFTWAINRARERKCHMVQLTSDKARPDAIRFYENLGFVASHEGMKLHLDDASAGSK
jgi:GNAT superfamily N-acetyltransferase